MKYKNQATGQEVSYTSDQLQDQAIGFLSDQFQPIQAASTPVPSSGQASSTIQNPASSAPQGARKLGPREFDALRMENKVGPGNFDQFFYKDPTGNIYLRPNAPGPTSSPTTSPKPSAPPVDARMQDESVEDFTSRLSAESGAQSPTGSSRFVGTSDVARAKMREQLKSELLPQGEMPSLPSLAEERIKLRKEQGIVNDEQDLADIRNEARMAEQELRQFRAQTGAGMTEFGRSGAVSEAERNAMFRLEGLALRERALVERVNSKNAFIDQVLKDQQMDFAAASEKWNQEFALNTKINDVLNAQMDDLQKDAMATVTTISNLMQESGTPYEQWPPEMKMQIETAALQAGLPKDTFKMAFGAQLGGEKVLSHMVQENASGGKDVYVLLQGKDGVKLQKVGGTEGYGMFEGLDAPELKNIDGKTYQWNAQTGTWELPSGPAKSQEELDALPDSPRNILAALEALKNHPGRGAAVGKSSIFNFIPGTKAASFINELNRVKSLLALPSLDLLKGPMSDKDLKFIQDAGSSLNPSSTESDFNAELDRLIKETNRIANQPFNTSSEGSQSFKLESPQDIDSFLDSFNSVGSGTNNAQIGSLSEKFESGGNPGAIGYDSTGGYSYGTYQLAHQNAKKFVEQSPYAREFSGLAFNSKAWQNKWRQVAQNDPQGFEKAQKKYIEQTHFVPQAQRLAKAGFDLNSASDVLKDVIWSTAVQHGAQTDVVEKALRRVGKNASEADLIKAIYNERWSGGRRFAGSNPEVQRSVKNRFFGRNGELATALSRLG